MPLATVSGHQAAIAIRVITVLTTILDGLPDEAGNLTQADGSSSTITLTNIVPDERGTWPSIQVEVTLGPQKVLMGLNRVDTDDQGNPIFTKTYTETLIILHVRALRDAERRYITDRLMSDIDAAFWVHPTTGEVYDGVIKLWLAEAGIVYKGMRSPRTSTPLPSDPRPEGQRFDEDLILVCDASVTWTGGTAPTLTGITSGITNISDNDPTPHSSITLVIG